MEVEVGARGMDKQRALTPLFPDMVFQRILSLGGDCEVAQQLRRTGRYQTPSVFDWLVTPLEAVSAVFADDGARLGLQFEAVHGGASVRCGAYGVLYHHEFPRTGEGQIRFDRDALDRCRGKLGHKMDKTLSALESGGAVLFVRTWPWTDLSWDRHRENGEPVCAADLNRLAAAIGDRFPSLDFRILVVGLQHRSPVIMDAPLDARIALETLAAAPHQGWRASDGAWDGLLDRIAYEPAARTDRSREALYDFGVDVVETTPSAAPATPPAALAAAEQGRSLWLAGRSHEAVSLFETAYRAGDREAAFLYDYLGLLSGETRYAEVLALAGELETLQDPVARRHVDMLAGHARLSLAVDRPALLADAAALEVSERWLKPQGLLGLIRARIAAASPFSFIRLGDGEARFAIERCAELHAGLTPGQTFAIGEVVWENWFGGSVADANREVLEGLWRRYVEAIRASDVLGIPDAVRLRGDTGHFGYLATQALWLRRLELSPAAQFTDAFAHYQLERLSPFLDTLLAGVPFLGVISPHEGLAEALQRRHGIAEVASYTVPGEGRLPTHAAARAAAAHFPHLFHTIMEGLVVPRRGAVFLVAAGLLGKVYCGRIRALGGIALDIGSLGDAWMGFDTRPGQMDAVGRLI